MPERRPRAAVAVGLAGAAMVAAAALWYGLSIATGLIFHFMPGAPALAGAWVFRTAARRPASWPEAALLAAGAALASLFGSIAIPSGGGSLDAPLLVAAAFVGGLAIAALVLRRN